MTVLAAALSLSGWAQTARPTVGEMLYRQGILPSGTPLTGNRNAGGSTSGVAAACVSCHRPSGLGTVEGRIVIPPITGKYLSGQGVQIAPQSHEHRVESATAGRSPYTDETLARVIRDGIDPDGRKLDYLMPHYRLDDATMSSLIAYLKQLSSRTAPGVTVDTLHFATIITPDADSVKRNGMLDVLEHFFAATSAAYRPFLAPQRPTRMGYRIPRKWQLHVWELTGDPGTWTTQLHKRLRAEPVFAVISGLGGKDWEPVHKFCEEESLPCLFPNVDLPVVAEGDFYNVYFSKGVVLEAELIAAKLKAKAGKEAPRRVIQVFREDDVGFAAARELCENLEGTGIHDVSRPLKPGEPIARLSEIFKDTGPRDALVLWLRPDDLRRLPSKPPKRPSLFFSGLMGGLEQSPINGEWRSNACMTYPFELPTRRGALMDYPLGWFRIQKIPVVAEETQVDTYIACGILAENLNNMLENFFRDYLVENIEVMLSTRIINGYYNRLGLAPGQRFASKGGYIVRFADAQGVKLIPDGDWVVP